MESIVAKLDAALYPAVCSVNTYLSNYILVFLLVAVGLWYSIKTRFVQVRCFGEGMRRVFGNLTLNGKKHDSGMSSFQALATAIAAQVGTGNIVGASGAILTGGPGAIFWMWVIAFFGMATIYAEATLAIKTRIKAADGTIHGGPVYYITTAFKGGFGKFLATLFAVAIILALGFMGCMVQSNSIGECIQTAFGIPSWIVGVALVIICGIIFLGGNFTHPHEKMAQIPVPYVISTIGAVSDGGKPCASVSVDDYRESYKMVDYLCSIGHRRIAIITACEDDISIGRLRLNAYRQALLDHGIPYDPDLVFHMTKDDTYSFATGYKITKEILEKKTEFSALYATADTLAIGACRALKEAGLTVPDDISVAGFDGIDAGEYYIPSITTIRQPVEQLAAETAKMLFSLISGKEEPCSKVYDGELVVRESTKSRIAQQ